MNENLRQDATTDFGGGGLQETTASCLRNVNFGKLPGRKTWQEAIAQRQGNIRITD
jgi:hypothetical protein